MAGVIYELFAASVLLQVNISNPSTESGHTAELSGDEDA